MDRRILLMYISEYSGHHQASIALEKAILEKDPECTTLNINVFKHTNPIMEKLTHLTYMRVIRRHPEIWRYLYDNPKVVKKTERIRQFANNAGSRKLDRLIREFRPDVIACTQAFPCGIAANYKKICGRHTPLVGILTDYAPHAYWIYEQVDAYVVPSDEIKKAMVRKGVPERRIKTFGTPIDPLFSMPTDKQETFEKLNLSPEKPVILVMGGTYGMGSDENLIRVLDNSKKDFQVIVVTGVNKRLFEKIKSIESTLRKKVIVVQFVKNVHELMDIAVLIITKPGGLTIAEALAKTLPMVILNPLPGQEDLNTRILTEKGVAIKAKDSYDAAIIVEELLDNPAKIQEMQGKIRENAKPRSALEIADFLLELAG